jgi:hypothetical protein
MTARQSHRRIFELQPLEGRMLLSCMSFAKQSQAALVSVEAAAFRAKGTLVGQFRIQGGSVNLSRLNGSMRSAGALKGSGQLDVTGDSITGGQIALRNTPRNTKVGSLTLELVGSTPLPTQKNARFNLSFHVVDATGAYSSALDLMLTAKVKLVAASTTRGTFNARFA